VQTCVYCLFVYCPFCVVSEVSSAFCPLKSMSCDTRVGRASDTSDKRQRKMGQARQRPRWRKLRQRRANGACHLVRSSPSCEIFLRARGQGRIVHLLRHPPPHPRSARTRGFIEPYACTAANLGVVHCRTSLSSVTSCHARRLRG
jgi:hypothetical protein